MQVTYWHKPSVHCVLKLWLQVVNKKMAGYMSKQEGMRGKQEETCRVTTSCPYSGTDQQSQSSSSYPTMNDGLKHVHLWTMGAIPSSQIIASRRIPFDTRSARLIYPSVKPISKIYFESLCDDAANRWVLRRAKVAVVVP